MNDVRIAYLDPFSGVSGEMLLGALLDVGAPEQAVLDAVSGLGLEAWSFEVTEESRRGIGATCVRIATQADGVVRTWTHIRELLTRAKLPEAVRARSLSAFERVARAEARIHRRHVDRVHFHEIGPADGLISIVGSCAAMHALDLAKVVSGPVAQGIGMARGELGLVPIPAPVVLEVLRGAPTYSTGIPAPLTTVAGAALVAEWADDWGALPALRAERIGYGAGHRQLDRPNVLRMVVGTPADGPADETPPLRLAEPLRDSTA